MKKELHYEVMHANESKPVGEVWWNADKKKIEASSPTVMNIIHEGHSGFGLKARDLLEALPRLFRSGYTTVRKAQNK